jgi:uncharacterized protein (DUF1684 family)
MRTILALLFLTIFNFGFAQEKFDVASIEKFQNGLNLICINPKTSPFFKKDREKFESLDFFPINEKFYVSAKLVKTEGGKPIKMIDNFLIKSNYVKYGEAHFYIDGKPFKLDLYYNIKHIKTEEGKDCLFLPFTDLTTGSESYIGGRFIDLKIPKGDTIIIDFNKSYNPCSAFRISYLKSKIPIENNLDIEIKAGIKKYRDE